MDSTSTVSRSSQLPRWPGHVLAAYAIIVGVLAGASWAAAEPSLPVQRPADSTIEFGLSPSQYDLGVYEEQCVAGKKPRPLNELSAVER